MAALVKSQVQEEISSEEVARRVAVLRRFKELLSQQRDRFREYLTVLDKQKDVIEGGSADDLLSHVELEEKIVANIFSIQKVIDPLEAMYKASFPQAVRSKRNQELLSKRMAELRTEIKLLKGNPYARRPSYSGENTASLIDIKG